MLLLALVASAMATAQNPPAPPRAHVLPPDDRARLPLQSTTPISQQFHDLLALAERLDPRQDDFLPEALAYVAERRLGALAQALAADADVADRIVEGGVSAPLIPPDLVIVLRDEPLVVRWPSATSRAIDEATTAPPAPLDGALRAFMAPFDPRDRQIEFSVVAIDAVGDAAYETTALVTAWGGAGDGVRQQNATWRIRWTHAPRGEPPDFDALERELRIAAIVPLDYEEVSDGGPRFVDQTGSVFSEVPGFADILANGTDYWFRRMDSIVGVDLLGHNGLAIGDVNGDGLDDLYLAQAGGLPNALFIQQRDGRVRDVAPAAAVDFLDMTRAALLVDMNNDGHLDLVLSVQNATVVMRGRGDGTFDPRPVLDARTLNMPSQFYSITAADYDSDGWLDLYTVRYVRSGYGVDVPVPLFDAQNGPPNHLISLLGIAPDGSWRFVERSEPAGLNQNNTRFSLAAAWEDFNDNGHPDLYVANDFGRANLYVNDGKRFRDEAEARGAFNQAAGMGVTWADYDRDGRMDLYVTNMYSPPGVRIMARPEFRQHDPPAVREQLVGHVMGNALFRGAAGGRFERAAQALRHGVEGWGWGAMFVDVNNDGYPDLLVPNGNLTGVRHEDMDSFYWRRVASVTPAEHANAPPYVRPAAQHDVPQPAQRPLRRHLLHQRLRLP